MNIFGLVPNIYDIQSAGPAGKSSLSTANYTGPSFAANMSNVTRAAMIQVAAGHQAASANIRKEKPGFDGLFSFTEAESELEQEYAQHIKKLLNRCKLLGS